MPFISKIYYFSAVVANYLGIQTTNEVKGRNEVPL
jgi:hypothetical protein